MALKIDKLQLQIEIMNDSAIQSLKKQEDELKKAKQELGKLNQGTQEYEQQLAKVKQLDSAYQEMAAQIKLTDMPLSMLLKRQKELNAILSNLRPSSENYSKYRAELDATKARISELKGTATSTASSLDKVASSVNKYATSVAATIISIVSAVNKASKYVDEYASMEEAQSQVLKYTNLTKEEVASENEMFKKLNTRTAREQLNSLAGYAGQLGRQGTKDISDFVVAADKINVALGEDIGKDAVKTIGRLASMFGEDKKKGLQGAMLATGSAINQLAQTVGVDANYLVDFTARVGGVANQSKISQADILGYAGVLNKNMQQVEMSGTAVQTVLMKMYQNPAKFAKLAGKDVKEFTNLLKNDANEAFLQLLGTLKGQGGMDKLAPIFEKMGLDGQRASQVLSTLAAKISDVRTQQKIANEAYKEGTSVDQEFNVQNNTKQAGLDKSKKQLKDLRIELGEKLYPVEMNALSLSTKSLSVLLSIIKFTGEHKKAIAIATAAIIAYTIAVNASIIADKLKVFWNDIVIKSFKALYIVLINNPWSAVIAGVAAVVTAIVLLKDRISETTQLRQSLNKVNDQTIEKYGEEAGKVESLNRIIHNSNISYNTRLKALNDLKAIVPDYHASLTKEGRLINDNTIAIDNYLRMFKQKIKAEAMEDELRDLYSKRAKTEMRLERVKDIKAIYNKADEKQKGGYTSDSFGRTASISPDYDPTITITAAKYGEELTSRVKELKGLNNSILYFEKQTGKSYADFLKNKPAQPTEENYGTGGTIPDKKKKGKKDNPYQDDTKTMEAEKQKELNDLKKYAQENNMTENEYNLSAIEINKKYLEQRLELIKKYQAKTKDKGQKAQLLKDEQDTQSALIDIDKQKGDAQVKVLEERRDEALKANDEYYNLQKQDLAKQYAEGKLNQYQYDATIAANELESKDKRLQILQGYGEDVKNEEIKNGQIKKKAVQDAEDAIVQAEIDSATSRAAALQAVKNVIINFQKETGLTNPETEKEEKLRVLKESYEQQRSILIANHQDTLQLDRLYDIARLAIEKDYQSSLLDIQEKNGIDVTKQRYALELSFLKAKHDAGLSSDAEYNAQLGAMDDNYLNGKLGKWEKTMQSISDIAGNVSSAVSGFAEAETVASDAKYDRQIKLAKKAGKDTTKLEEQKEAAQQQIKKKYADMQFASAVLQIGSSTAVAIMNAFASWESVGPWGHALAIAVAASIAASGAAQIAVAKANRDAAKGLYSGGYSSDYSDGGYTPNIDPHDVGGYIPVHGNEFVANHEAVANPHVNRFFRVIDLAQKNGTIRMLDTTAILQQLQLGGKYSGGYTNTQSTDPIVVNQSGGGDVKTLSDKMDTMIELLTTMSGKKIVLSLTDVRDGLNDLSMYESNASR